MNLALIREYLSYEPETGVFRWIKRAPRSKYGVGSTAGTIDGDGYRRIIVLGKRHLAHQLAWQLTHGEIPGGLELDHKNHQRDDNRIANLRLATRSENNANSKHRRRASKYRGISRCSQTRLIKAAIRVGGRTVHIGYYETEEHAARAYDVAAIWHFGDFATLNFPLTETPSRQGDRV